VPTCQTHSAHSVADSIRQHRESDRFGQEKKPVGSIWRHERDRNGMQLKWECGTGMASPASVFPDLVCLVERRFRGCYETRFSVASVEQTIRKQSAVGRVRDSPARSRRRSAGVKWKNFSESPGDGRVS